MGYTGIKKKGFYKTGEASKILNLSKPTVVRYIKRLELPYLKLTSKHYRIPHSSLVSLAEYMGLTITENENGFIQN